MGAQRPAGIVGAEQPAPLEDRHHLVDEGGEAVRGNRRHDVEAVGGALLDPAFDMVGDRFRGAGQHLVAAPAGEAAQQLAQRRALALDQSEDHLRAALRPLHRLRPREGVERDRLVQREEAEVEAVEALRQMLEADHRQGEVVQLLFQRVGLRLRRAEDGRQAGQDLDAVRVAAEGDGAALHVGIEILRVGELLLGGEDRLGIAGGEGAALVRGARLHQHRMALRRARQVERAAHAELLAGVVDGVDAVGVGVDAAGAVMDARVVLPAVPQLAHDIDELGRATIAVAVRVALGEAEIAGRLGRPGGDDVPARPSGADMVERGELAGEVVGLVVGGGGGADQPDVLGRAGDGGEQGQRFQLALRDMADAAADGELVGEEHGIELAALGDARDLPIIADVGDALGLRLRVEPRGLVMAGGGNEDVEVKAGIGRHSEVPWAFRVLARAQSSLMLAALMTLP